MAILSYTDLRKGTVYVDSDHTYLVLSYEHNKRGRGAATVRVKVRDVESGSITEKTYTSGSKLEEANIAKNSAQFLYSDGKTACFMDNSTYEQFEIPEGDVKDQLNYLTEGAKAVILSLDEKPISVEIPGSVELKVEYTEPAVKGDTATGATKPAKLETGLEVNVPLFIEKGERIRINTATGEYTCRV